MADKLIYIPIDDTQNYPFYRLKLLVENFGTSSLKLIKTNIKVGINNFDKNVFKNLAHNFRMYTKI